MHLTIFILEHPKVCNNSVLILHWDKNKICNECFYLCLLRAFRHARLSAIYWNNNAKFNNRVIVTGTKNSRQFFVIFFVVYFGAFSRKICFVLYPIRNIQTAHGKYFWLECSLDGSRPSLQTVASNHIGIGKRMPEESSVFDELLRKCHRWYILFMGLRYSSSYFGAANGYYTCLPLAMGKI